ncbi:unnamed protein product, partial [Pylaiella littoralis]
TVSQLSDSFECGLSRSAAVPAAAAKVGRLDLLKCAHDMDCGYDEKTITNAAAGGHIDVLNFAYDNRYPWERWANAAAAGNGQVQALEWLDHRGCHSVREEVCVEAAKAGRLNVLKYLEGKGCPSGMGTSLAAAEQGHLVILTWVYNNEEDTAFRLGLGRPSGIGMGRLNKLCACAAKGGHLSVIVWARSKDFFWNESTCTAAARGGFLDILQYCRTNGCPW